LTKGRIAGDFLAQCNVALTSRKHWSRLPQLHRCG